MQRARVIGVAAPLEQIAQADQYGGSRRLRSDVPQDANRLEAVVARAFACDMRQMRFVGAFMVRGDRERGLRHLAKHFERRFGMPKAACAPQGPAQMPLCLLGIAGRLIAVHDFGQRAIPAVAVARSVRVLQRTQGQMQRRRHRLAGQDLLGGHGKVR